MKNNEKKICNKNDLEFNDLTKKKINILSENREENFSEKKHEYKDNYNNNKDSNFINNLNEYPDQKFKNVDNISKKQTKYQTSEDTKKIDNGSFLNYNNSFDIDINRKNNFFYPTNISISKFDLDNINFKNNENYGELESFDSNKISFLCDNNSNKNENFFFQNLNCPSPLNDSFLLKSKRSRDFNDDYDIKSQNSFKNYLSIENIKNEFPYLSNPIYLQNLSNFNDIDLSYSGLKRDLEDKNKKKFIIKTYYFQVIEDNTYSLKFNSNNNSINDMHIDKKNELPNKIEIIKFNYKHYKHNYYHRYQHYKFVEPKIISLQEIIINYSSYLSPLWTDEKNKIFESIDELKSFQDKGIILKNLLIILDDKIITNKECKNLIRKFGPDNMSSKIKNYLLNQIIAYINSFEPMKNNEIKTLIKDLVNNNPKSDFNYVYLEQNLYNILSNDSNDNNTKSNFEKLKSIIDLYNEQKKHIPLIKNLCLKVKDCLDIFRYKKKEDENHPFKNKLVAFLKKEYDNFELKNVLDEIEKIKFKKDYIVSFILLTYNLERLFYLMSGQRGFKNDRKLINIFFKIKYLKLFIKKLKNYNK